MTKRLLQQALDQSAAAIVILDREARRIEYANPAAERLLDLAPGALPGRDFASLCVAGSEVSLDARSAGATQRICWRTAGGRPCEVQLTPAPLIDAQDEIAFWMLTAIGDPAQVGAPGQPAATTDAVTGLPDRASFEQALARDWAAGRRVRSRVSLLLFRVDAFPAYRDVFGRHAAESCLRKVGHAIGGCLRRDADLVARYAEDQFVALIGGADEERAAEFAQRIADRVRLLAIHHPRSPTDRFVTVTWSAAVQSPGLRDDCRQLLRHAESGLPGMTAEARAADSA